MRPLGPSARRLDRSLLVAARALAAEGMVVGTVGNVSARTPAGVRITPTALAYDRMSRADLVTVGHDGRRVAGRRAPSRELPLHLAVYRARPEIGAVVHCHSPWATAWSFLDEALGPATEEITYYAIGPVRTSRPAAAGSADLATTAVEALGASGAALLGRHGTLAVGAGVEEAMNVARALEHQAHVAWLVRLSRSRAAPWPSAVPAAVNAHRPARRAVLREGR
ncbi:MAG: class aldolase/adducin family protein [Conexibacter sp.]|nr:class aldolase/adducin family protein [Conexibacter sp.]